MVSINPQGHFGKLVFTGPLTLIHTPYHTPNGEYGDVPDEVNIKDEVAVGNDDERIWVSLFSLLSILLEAILDSPHYWLSHSRDKGSLVSVFRLITSIMMTIWIYPCHTF